MKRNFLNPALFAFAFVFALAGCGKKGGGVVYLKEYLTDGSPIETTFAFRNAVEECRATKASRLVIPEGTYHLSPDLAFEKYHYSSNNTAELKRVVFDLSGLEDFTVEGNGAQLLFDGFVAPFFIDSCRNVTVKDLSIDYVRTFYSEGVITAVGDGWMDLRFPADYIWKISEDGILYFYDKNGVNYPYKHLLEWDSERREPAFMAADYWLREYTIHAEDRPDGTVRIFKKGLTGTVGNVMMLGPANRICSAFSIADSEGVSIRDVNIYHCGGMGVVAERSRDIELERVNVVVPPGSGRMISITADATHFSHCGGYIRMLECRFFNQIDDATNIHGMYAEIKHIDGDRMRVYYTHDQQWGYGFFKPGMTVELVRKGSLVTYAKAVVRDVRFLNKEWLELTFTEPVPADAVINDVITEADNYAEVLIKGCRMGNNRARGLLLGSRAHTVIEENYFHIPGSAIYFEGDSFYWFEQAGVRDVVIRNNVFDHCNYGYYRWGDACISVGSGPMKERLESLYNRNIMIEENTFLISDPRILYLYSVDGCVFRNNTIEKDDKYPYTLKETRPFVVEDSVNIDIEGYNPS